MESARSKAMLEADAAAPPRSTGRAGWTTVSHNLIPALLSAALVAVMIFAFTTLDNRITSLKNRLTAFENRVDARFAALDKTEVVGAALAGEVPGSAPPASDIERQPPEPP